MNSDLAQYKDLFLQTAQEYITALEKALQDLRTNPTQKEAIDTIHLSAHSLKSQNNALGFSSTALVFMGIEQLFKKYQEAPAPISSELIELVQTVVDEFNKSLEHLKTENTERDLSDLAQRIQTQL